MNSKPWLRPILTVGLVLFIDQLVKLLVRYNMFLGEEFSVIGDWFLIHFTENNGMAFGLEFAGEYGKLLLTVFRIGAVGVIIWIIRNLLKNNAKPGLVIAVSLILAGAAGNIIDSVFYGILFDYAPLLHGRVVDMLYFPIVETTWPSWSPLWAGEELVFFRPVFNIADSSITIGVCMILLFQKRFFSQPAGNLPPSETTNPIATTPYEQQS